MFISHTGEVYPSGFLPLTAGSIKTEQLGRIYRDSELFRTIRDPDLLPGRCGSCEFRSVCGGSRPRAFGATGDLLADEPLCEYIPGSFGFADEVAGYLAGPGASHAPRDAAAPGARDRATLAGDHGCSFESK